MSTMQKYWRTLRRYGIPFTAWVTSLYGASHYFGQGNLAAVGWAAAATGWVVAYVDLQIRYHSLVEHIEKYRGGRP